MRTKVTLVLLFLNVALFFFIFQFERDWQTQRTYEETRRRVLGAETANLKALAISGPGVPQEIILERRSEGADDWHLTRPIAWPANSLAVENIVTALQQLEHLTFFRVAELAPADQSLATYGLDQPRLTVRFTAANGSESTLRLGSDTADGKNLYVLSPDGAVIHVVSRGLVPSLTQPVDVLRDPAIFSIPRFEVRSLVINPSNTRIQREEGDRWGFVTPLLARASRLAVTAAINDLNSLRVRQFVSTPPAGIFPEAGFALRLSLEGNNRIETLRLGETVPAPAAPAPGPAPAGTEYYARMEPKPGEDATQVFTVVLPASLLSTLRNAQVDLREPRILADLENQTVTAITIGNPDPALELQRLEAPVAGGESRASWRFAQRGPAAGNGTEPQPADTPAVQALVERLGRLAVIPRGGFVNDSPPAASLADWGLSRPERRITLTLAAPPRGRPATIELSLGRAGARAFARRSDAESVYEIDPEIFSHLPVDRNAWRDRLLRELPAGSQIIALTLTDLRTNGAILTQVFPPAAGAPAPAPAVTALAAQLRTLRAQRLAPEPFNPAEVLDVNGVRPWRYRLDLTIAQAGGGAQGTTSSIFLTERTGGGTAPRAQVAGSPEFGVWDLDQGMIDALAAVVGN